MGELTGRERERAGLLTDLRFHWGTAYQITFDGGWKAWRIDGSADELEADSADELRRKIRSDYSVWALRREASLG